VTETNVRRIRAGMTVEQVEAVLGGAAEWKIEIDGLDPETKATCFRSGERCSLAWRGQEGVAAVNLNEAGRVARAWWEPHPDENPPSPIARLHAWLGW
jgi:hypothetical protein